MKIQLGFTKNQVISTLKVGLFIGGSAFIDYIISVTNGTQFGQFTAIINMLAVAIKQFVFAEKK